MKTCHELAVIKVENTLPEQISMNTGVRQECERLQYLFNLYSETIFEKAFKNVDHGIMTNEIKIGGMKYGTPTPHR